MRPSSQRARIALKLAWLFVLMVVLVTLWSPAPDFIYEAF